MPDLVNCVRLSEEAVVLERVFELCDLPRLQDLVGAAVGSVRASFNFANVAEGRPAAKVTVVASPRLICQRCLHDFALPILASSVVEFTHEDDAASADSAREFFRLENGLVSLRDLAEEELLLALPIAPMCSTPATCGKAPDVENVDKVGKAADAMRRPFSALQELLKKT